MTAQEDLLRGYRAAFLRYLARREEAALDAGYQLGRGALAQQCPILDVVRVHHDVLMEVLRDGPAEEASMVAGAASDFLLEVLASYDMAQRRSPQEG